MKIFHWVQKKRSCLPVHEQCIESILIFYTNGLRQQHLLHAKLRFDPWCSSCHYCYQQDLLLSLDDFIWRIPQSSPDCISYHFCLLYGILFCRMGGDRTCKSVKLRTSNCVCHSLVFSHPTFLPLSPFCIIVTSSILVYFLNLKKKISFCSIPHPPPLFFSPMTTRGRKGGSLLYVIPLWLTVFLPPSS